ncbi:MAG: glycosyltransferase, partial [Candidatus Altiarchaeota archaeon]
MISVFIPAYEEESILACSVDRVSEALRGLEYEIFIVDDASTDSTPKISAQLAAADRRIRHVRYDNGPTRRE